MLSLHTLLSRHGGYLCSNAARQAEACLHVAEHLGCGGLEVELHGKLEVVVDGVQPCRDCQKAVVAAMLQEHAQGFEARHPSSPSTLHTSRTRVGCVTAHSLTADCLHLEAVLQEHAQGSEALQSISASTLHESRTNVSQQMFYLPAGCCGGSAVETCTGS